MTSHFQQLIKLLCQHRHGVTFCPFNIFLAIISLYSCLAILAHGRVKMIEIDSMTCALYISEREREATLHQNRKKSFATDLIKMQVLF